MTTFSIITPFYKGNRYIANIFQIAEENRASLKKILPESRVELIIVNDSPETEVQIPDNADPDGFRILHHDKNRGIHQARISGLQKAEGEFVLLLDQDDTVASDFLAQQYEKLGDADMVVALAMNENSDGTCLPFYDTPGKIRKLTEFSTYLKSHNQIISPGQCLIRKNAIPQEWCSYVLEVNGSDDLFLWILMFEQKKKIVIHEKCLYTHKYTGENLSESGDRMGRSTLDLVKILRQIPYVPDKDIRTLERSRKMDLSMSSGDGRLTAGIRNADIILHRAYWKLKSR